MNKLTFAIIIPTRNEARDIIPTIECCEQQTYPAAEILVVDDSDDPTPEIIENARERIPQLHLIRGNRTGRTGARNQGILASSADVVVLLNADVHLPPNFLECLIGHYQAGAGYVLVGWKVANPQAVRGRFIEAQSYFDYASDESIEWTEGFSCRRDLAIDAGLFPISPIPLVAGEDGPFGVALSKVGRKIVDRSIQVSFVAPVDGHEFWRTYKERAYPHAHYYLYQRTLAEIALRTVAKQFVRFMRLLFVAPVLIHAWRLCDFSPQGRRDWLPFLATDLFQQLAYTVGEWEGFIKLRRGVNRTTAN